MPDPKFRSTLSIEEIEENFKDMDIFAGIMEGLQETLRHVRSKEDSS